MSWKMVASIAVLIVVGFAAVPQVMDALWAIPVAVWNGLREAIKMVVSQLLKTI